MHYLRILCFLILLSCNEQTDRSADLRTGNKSTKPITSPAKYPSSEPFLFRDHNGNIYLSWMETLDSSRHALKYARLLDSGWLSPVTIAQEDSLFVNWADYPRFATDGHNHFIYAFLKKSGTSTYAYDVMATNSRDGVNWSAPVKLHDDTATGEHGFMSIATHPENGFVISWLDGRNTGYGDDEHHHNTSTSQGMMTLRAAWIDTSGQKIRDNEIDNSTCDCCQTSLAIGASGPVIVYRNRTENEIRDIFISRWKDDRWSSPENLSKDNWMIDGCPVNGPAIDAIDNTVAVVWYTETGKKPAVYARFSNDGGAHFAEPIRIHDSIPLGRLDLSLMNSKKAIITWMEGSSILARGIGMAGEAGPIVRVATNSTARAAGFPQVVCSKEEVIFAWTDFASKRIMTASRRYTDF